MHCSIHCIISLCTVMNNIQWDDIQHLITCNVNTTWSSVCPGVYSAFNIMSSFSSPSPSPSPSSSTTSELSTLLPPLPLLLPFQPASKHWPSRIFSQPNFSNGNFPLWTFLLKILGIGWFIFFNSDNKVWTPPMWSACPCVSRIVDMLVVFVSGKTVPNRYATYFSDVPNSPVSINILEGPFPTNQVFVPNWKHFVMTTFEKKSTSNLHYNIQALERYSWLGCHKFNQRFSTL